MKTVIAVIAALFIIAFQNCSNVTFGTQAKPQQAAGLPDDSTPLGDLPSCEGVSCELTPLTSKPAVTTILLALGDESNQQLVVNAKSAQFIAESVVRYSSPAAKPKILLVRDSNSGDESKEDWTYAASLLVRYDVTPIDEPSAGLTASDLAGYDLVWINNPGAPMGKVESRDALIAFKGAVVLQGDDLAWGKNFSMTELTGLKFIDNGTSVRCEDGRVYNHNDNGGEQYWVNLNPEQMTGVSSSAVQFRYGNDIDNTTPAREDLQILASAKGGPDTCTSTRPAIVRYLR